MDNVYETQAAKDLTRQFHLHSIYEWNEDNCVDVEEQIYTQSQLESLYSN